MEDAAESLGTPCPTRGHEDFLDRGLRWPSARGLKRLLRGIERADSVGLDAHKWFFQPYEVGCLSP